MTPIAFNDFVKRIVCRGVHHHAVARSGPETNQLGHHVDDGRAIHDGFGINVAVKALAEPVRDGGEKFIVFPAAVAKHAVVDALMQRVSNAGGGGEIHIRDGEGQQVGRAKTVGDVVPLCTPGAVTIHDGREIKHHVSP